MQEKCGGSRAGMRLSECCDALAYACSHAFLATEREHLLVIFARLVERAEKQFELRQPLKSVESTS